jgi:hypothetical protein
MSKVATKFIAGVVVKVGRQSMTIKIPLDLAECDPAEGSTLGDVVLDIAKSRIDKGMKLQVSNLANLKSAFKAYKKAHP